MSATTLESLSRTRVKFNHPNKNGIAAHGIRMIKDWEKFHQKYMYPEIFFSWIFVKASGVSWYSKDQLYKAIEGKVRRPNSQFVNFKSAERLVRKPKRNDYPVNALAEKIERLGKIYLKPVHFFASGGEGIITIEKKKNEIIIRASEKWVFERIVKTLPIGTFTTTPNKKIVIRLSANQSLKQVLRKIASSSVLGGSIIEEEIKAPLFKGRKWEIRTIVQSPEKKPEVIAHLAKIGAEASIVSNINLGGHEIEASKVISEIYTTIYPKKSGQQIRTLTQEFFSRANAEAIKTVKAINSHTKNYARRYMHGFPESEMYMREIAIDIAGEFNPKTGKLDPVIGEAQVDFGYGPEFEIIDPLGWKRFKENRAKMVDEGRKLLMKAFGLG
ncbi:MAG: hypothetical protein Q7S21_03545 [archaeon]|nr:hypothetical protein [archaeon]